MLCMSGNKSMKNNTCLSVVTVYSTIVFLVLKSAPGRKAGPGDEEHFQLLRLGEQPEARWGARFLRLFRRHEAQEALSFWGGCRRVGTPSFFKFFFLM